VTSALEVFKNDMRYINSRFTYLLTYRLRPMLLRFTVRLMIHQFGNVVQVFLVKEDRQEWLVPLAAVESQEQLGLQEELDLRVHDYTTSLAHQI